MIKSLHHKNPGLLAQKTKAETENSANGSARQERQKLLEEVRVYTQKNWQVKDVLPKSIKLEKKHVWNWKLFFLGLVTLPFFGLGLLVWLLTLLNFLFVRQTLEIGASKRKPGSLTVKNLLDRNQKILLGVFGFLILAWLLVFMIVYLPGQFYSDLPLAEEIHTAGISLTHSSLDILKDLLPSAPLPVKAAHIEITGTPQPTDTGSESLETQTPETRPSLTSAAVWITPTLTPLMPLDPTRTATLTSTPEPTQTSIPAPNADNWKDWPVYPEISERAREIYQEGLEKGGDPNHFSIVGDCQSMPYLFLGVYDNGAYNLGEDTYLQDTIDQFSGSFTRYGMTIIDGGNAATQIATGWANRTWCDFSESPLDCELRLHKPSIIFIHVGTHWSGRNGQYLREIVEKAIDQGALPIMVTKADNLEGNYSINRDIAQISLEYDIPLFNFWATVQDLPNGGLDPYRQGGYMYLVSSALERHRSSALYMLDKVWRAVR